MDLALSPTKESGTLPPLTEPPLPCVYTLLVAMAPFGGNYITILRAVRVHSPMSCMGATETPSTTPIIEKGG